MTDEDRAPLVAAVNKLVVSPDAMRLFETLQEAIPVARRLGLRFVGDSTTDLNPLLDLACRHPDHYDNVLNLVEQKRESAGLPPLDPQRGQVEKFDKSEYMARFMQAKRMRERKAADIENMMRPESQHLVGRARLDFMQLQSAKWRVQLDAMLAARRAELGGERIKRTELEALRSTFWDQVDRELAEMEAYARMESLKPVHQRRPYKK